MLLGLPHHNGMAFLENLVDRDKGFERLDLVGKDRLSAMIEHTSARLFQRLFRYQCHIRYHSHFHARPKGRRRLVVPCVHDTAPHMLPCNEAVSVESNAKPPTAQNESSQGAMERNPDVRLGAVSSVAS